MPEQVTRLLIVDDDRMQLEMLTRLLRMEGFEVHTANEAIGVSKLILSVQPDVVLLDVNIPALSGDRLLSLARKHAPAATKFVLFSACDEEQLRSLAVKTQADGWISKSWDQSRIIKKLQQLRPRPTLG